MIAYHGSKQWDAILHEGLIAEKADRGEPGATCAHIRLAVTPDIAAVFGPVLVVDIKGLDFDWIDRDEPASQPYWQGCYHEGDLGPERIRFYNPARDS